MAAGLGADESAVLPCQDRIWLMGRLRAQATRHAREDKQDQPGGTSVHSVRDGPGARVGVADDQRHRAIGVGDQFLRVII